MQLDDHILEQALALHRQGQSVEAAAIYRRILAQVPSHADALHLLGLLAHQARHLRQAAHLIQRAILARYDFQVFHSNLAVVLSDLGEPEQARLAQEAAQRLWQGALIELMNRGLLLREQGQVGEALAIFDTLVGQAGHIAEFHHNRGTLLSDLGQQEQALLAWCAALILRPDFVPSLIGAASFWLDHASPQNALRLTSMALAVDRELDAGWLIQAKAQRALAHPNEAFATLSRGLVLRPENAALWLEGGEILIGIKRADDGLCALHRGMRLDPFSVESRIRLGFALYGIGRPELALEHYDAALCLQPSLFAGWLNRGTSLFQLGHFQAAITSYTRAAHMDPGAPKLRVNIGMSQLVLGQFTLGWQNFEARIDARVAREAAPNYAMPKWSGQPLQGRSILLHPEEGLGDTIQFCRYVPILAKMGARVYLGTPTALTRLLATLEGLSGLVADPATLPSIDFYSPLMSLPGVLGSDLNAIPAKVPYLAAQPDLERTWRQRLSRHPRRIGIVWRGNPTHQDDKKRSVSLDHFAAFLDLDLVDTCFVALQKDPTPDERAFLRRYAHVIDASLDLGDFADTAALVSCLDLVISVDTSLAHLAGAMARPVWVALPFVPDWRWLTTREDSPWYPTMRLFRQPARGAWPEVFGSMAMALRDMSEGSRAITVDELAGASSLPFKV